MKVMRKSRVSLAVVAGVFAAGLAGGVQAEAVIGATTDQTQLGAGVAVNGEIAPIVDPNNVGDLLLFPYYTTQNDHNTLIHLQNTSIEHTVIAKVRFRDYVNSNDAMDYTVILSPGDIYTAIVRDEDGTPTVVSTDNTCTSPLTGMGGKIAFPSSVDSPNKHTGHIEVIVEGVINHSDVLADWNAAPAANRTGTLLNAYNLTTGAKHANDIPANCAAVDSYFASTTASTNLSAAVAAYSNVADAAFVADGTANANVATVVDTANVLAGHYVILNSSNGYAAGGRPVAVQDFTASRATDNAVDNPCGGTDGNLICSQTSTHFPFPNLMNVGGANSASIITAPSGTVTAGVAGTVGDEVNRRNAINALELALAGSSVKNEWSTASKNGVDSEIVYTQFAKYVRRDLEPVNTVENNNMYYNAGYTNTASSLAPASSTNDANAWDNVDSVLSTASGTGVATGPNAVGQATANIASNGLYDNSTGCIAYTLNVYDREEDTSTTTNVSAPSGSTVTTSSTELCNEVTVFTFGEGVTNPTGSMNVSTSAVNQNFGWVNITTSAEGGAAAGPGGASGSLLPTIGHGMWRRNFGDAALNYGQIIDNIKQ